MRKTSIELMTMNEEERVAAKIIINCGLDLLKISAPEGVIFVVVSDNRAQVLKTRKFKRIKDYALALATKQNRMGLKAAMRRTTSALAA